MELFSPTMASQLLRRHSFGPMFCTWLGASSFGPGLGRPHVDTLAGSRHANMKELRFHASDGVWRVAFAFDPERRAILLVAGDKSGVAQARFYKRLIKIADGRFTEWLSALPKPSKER